MQKRSKSKREMELEAKEIRAATGEPRLYYPGGAQGGGSTRKKSGSPVVRPHVKTHSRCKDCGLFHTPEQHEAHSAWKGGAASAGPRAASGPVARSGAKAQGRRAKTSALPTALPSRSAASLDTAELVDPTALPSGSAASLDTAELVAKAVHQVAPKIKQSQRGGKWRGRIGVNVFIDAVWRLLHKQPSISRTSLTTSRSGIPRSLTSGQPSTSSLIGRRPRSGTIRTVSWRRRPTYPTSGQRDFPPPGDLRDIIWPWRSGPTPSPPS